LAPEKAKRLSYNICEDDHHLLEFCTYDVSEMIIKSAVKQFAGWITHGHLHFLTTSASKDEGIRSALVCAYLVDEVDYRDELVDTWMLWLRDGKPPGSLNVTGLSSCPETWSGLRSALILWHDARAVLVPSSVTQRYSEHICKEVRMLAETYFINQKPKDPLELSDKQFCDLYHAHNEVNLPCYKEKRASQDV
jgi:hypothetical protein